MKIIRVKDVIKELQRRRNISFASNGTDPLQCLHTTLKGFEYNIRQVIDGFRHSLDYDLKNISPQKRKNIVPELDKIFNTLERSAKSVGKIRDSVSSMMKKQK